MKPKDKLQKKVVKYKDKNNSMIERSGNLKAESHRDINKSFIKEKDNNLDQHSLYNLQSYKNLESEDNRRTLKPNYMNKNQVNNNTPLRRTLFLNDKKKDKEKPIISKNKKKEKDNPNSKHKKMVNFNENKIKMKSQKSERYMKKKTEDLELKLNKSMGNILNENDKNYDDINNDKEIIKPKKTYDSNKRIPNLKNLKEREDKEEKEGQINDEEDEKIDIPEKQSLLEIITIKSDIMQLNKEVINNEDTNKDKNKDSSLHILKKVNFIKEDELSMIEKELNKEQNKKGNKISNNYEQNLSYTTKNKKGKISNIFKKDEGKVKFGNAAKKVKAINKAIKGTQKNKDLRQTVRDPLISNLKDDLINEPSDDFIEKKNNSNKYLLNDININDNSNKNILKNININDKINSPKNNYDNFTGLILLKYDFGERILELKLEGTIDNINNILNEKNIKIDNKEIVIIDKNGLDKLKKENEKIQEEFLKLKEEYDKQKELLSSNKDALYYNLKKKITSIEEENEQMEEENVKIKEIKDRIQRYKDELKKGNGNEGFKNERMSCRVKLNKKDFSLEQKMKDFEKKREMQKKEKEKKMKQIENSEKKELNNINNNSNTKIITKNLDINNKDINSNNDIKNTNKKENNNINLVNKDKTEKKENKEKDKNKGYSKALDRFKKRYKNSNSMEIRTKKSERINEIAKRLENVMGKQQSQVIDEANNTTEIIHHQPNIELIENQPYYENKTSRKPKRPQI